MKYILTYCLLFFSYSYSYCQQSNAQGSVPPLPLKANRIVYSDTIKVSNTINKDQLLHNAEEWYIHNFETADNTLIIDNAVDGEISGTGIIHVKKKENEIDPADIFFTVDIVTANGWYTYKVTGIYSLDKDNKFYYSDMYNEELYPADKPKWTNAYRNFMLKYMNERIQEMILKMQKDLTKK